MHAPDDGTTPARSGLRRLVTPWEYRHRRAVGGVRLAAGGFQAGVGAVLLSLGLQAGTSRERRTCFGWAAWFLVFGALNVLGGGLDLAADRAAPAKPAIDGQE
jgi:hypothetical protein